jgi:hypothetical protein
MSTPTSSGVILNTDNLVPRALLNKIVNHDSFARALARYTAMEDDDLLHTTEACLKNLGRLDNEPSLDGDLRHILVPELWERIRPGTRDPLRRISTTLAEYRQDPTKPSFFKRVLSPESYAQLQEFAGDLRQRVKRAARLDVLSLVEQARFAIAGSRADRWTPDACVYEPRFTYRMVPVIAGRALDRSNNASVGISTGVKL